MISQPHGVPAKMADNLTINSSHSRISAKTTVRRRSSVPRSNLYRVCHVTQTPCRQASGIWRHRSQGLHSHATNKTSSIHQIEARSTLRRVPTLHPPAWAHHQSSDQPTRPILELTLRTPSNLSAKQPTATQPSVMA